mgnify:CR=1 FL=1
MTSFQEELQNLYEKIRLFIIEQVAEKGVESKFSNKVVIKVDDDRSFNLDGERYLEEVGQHELFDNQGYAYNFSELSYDDLTDLADYISEL